MEGGILGWTGAYWDGGDTPGWGALGWKGGTGTCMGHMVALGALGWRGTPGLGAYWAGRRAYWGCGMHWEQGTAGLGRTLGDTGTGGGGI